MVVVSLFLVSLVISLMEEFTLDFEVTQRLIPSDVLVEISPSSNHPKPLLERLPGRNTQPRDQVLCGNIEPMLDYTCRPPRPTGLFAFSGGIHHRSRPFVPIQHSGFRYVESLTPEQISAGTGVFIPRVPIPAPPPPMSAAISARRTTACPASVHGLCRTVMVRARFGMKHVIRNGGEASNNWDFPDELLPLELCLPEDWTY